MGFFSVASKGYLLKNFYVFYHRFDSISLKVIKIRNTNLKRYIATKLRLLNYLLFLEVLGDLASSLYHVQIGYCE
jgi:hypothetical protein